MAKQNKLKPVKKFVKNHRKALQIFGVVALITAFAVTGATLLNRSKAAIGECSTSGVVGKTTHPVTIQETGQYKLWVRMQVPDTNNSGSTNGVHVEIDNAQCFIVTTTASNNVNQWRWVNTNATAPSTPHVTSSLSAGSHSIEVIGKKADVKVDKILLLPNSSTCTPSNNFTNGEPGENCTTPPPTVSLSATPSTVTSGSASQLNWSSTNANTCTASGDWSGSKATSGNQSTGNLTSDKTYSLNCSGPGGSTTQNTAVTIQTPTPTLSFSANPSTVTSGQNTNLTWSTTNATSCTASGSWSGNKSTSGTESTSTLTSSQTYTLNCSGAGGNVTRNVTVSVQTPSDPPVISMTLAGFSVPDGASTYKVTSQRSVEWRPSASSVAGIQTRTYRVNNTVISLTNGGYTFGAAGNGNFDLSASATGNNSQTTTSTLTVQVRHPDFSRNGSVDLLDLSLLLREWNKTNIPYDIDISGKVDLYDLSYVLRNWGTN